MKLTPAQWKKLEGLITPFSSAKLRIDGHEITIQFEQYKGTKFCYSVYVDGYIRGVDSNKESEIGQKFWRPMMISMFKAKDVKAMEKILGKKRAKEKGYTNEKRLVGHSPYFTSFRTLKQVLSKNESIEVLD